MSKALKALQEKHAAKTAEAQSLIDQGKTESDPAKAAEAAKAARTVLGELDEIKAQIDTLNGASAMEQQLAAHKAWDSEPANAIPQPGQIQHETKAVGSTTIDLMTGEFLDESGAGLLTNSQMKVQADPAYLKAFVPFLRGGGKLENVKDADARKTLVEGIDDDGGQLVPAQIIAGILMRTPANTALLDRVQVITVSSDKALMLRSNYTSDDLYASAVRVYKTAEGSQTQETNQPQFGTLTIDVHAYTAELSITRQLLEDTAFDIVGFITEQFRIACRNFSADKILNGTGVGEHFGILTRADAPNGPAVVKSGDANLLTWAGLRKIKNAVPEQYDTNSVYVFNKKSTQDAIEALVDNDGRPLWPEAQRSGLEAGTPGTLQGYGYIREARMPDVAANNMPYLFGDPRCYVRALRLGMTIEQLREIEARSGRVVFLCRFREGGDIAEPWRMRVGKIAA